jgi:hypothetical protein
MTKLRDSARDEVCTLRIEGVCNRDPATTVLCHIRDFSHGGMGLKPSDSAGVFGCSRCHDALDRRVRNELFERDRNWYIARALIDTHARMIEKGVLR